jgi:CRISPR/Cas system Type II protein with McrA/HNH and RuvC-like nuclease domain
MKKILGLDIGTTSIGWAIVDASEEKKVNDINGKVPETDINNDRIGIHKDTDGNHAVGVRIISQDDDRFIKGEKLNQGANLTPTAERRVKRGARRLKSRYKLRRGKLALLLDYIGMQPDKGYFTNEKGKRGEKNDIGRAIYELRDRAIREKISLNEWGRIIIHLNQWRGYSSDRFAKEEKTTFDYYTAEIIVLDLENKIAIYDDKNKDLLKYNKISITLKFNEPINIGDNETQNWVTEISGFIFKQKFEYKVGDIITIKAPEWKQDKKGKTIISEYYKITDTTPDPTDWNYKYQTLQKTLTEWCSEGNTVGSFFYQNYYQHQNIERIRNNVVNRKWYEDEFDKIFDFQFEYHKDQLQRFSIEDIVKIAFKNYQPILNEVLNKYSFKEQLRFLIKDKIIYYQRPWQQAKNKGECPFEFVPDVKKEKDGSFVPNKHGKRGVDKYGKEIFLKGRTVIPRSHPLYQDYRMWQKINNLRIYLHTPSDKIDLFDNPETFKEVIGKSIEETKELLYKTLQDCKSKAWKSFCAKELGLENFLFDNEEQAKVSKKQLREYIDKETRKVTYCYFSVNFRKRKKDGTYTDLPLDGNKTKKSIKDILETQIQNIDDWFEQTFKSSKDKHNLQKICKDGKAVSEYNYKTENYSVNNLQALWECIYDITNSDASKVAKIIKRHFNDFDDSTCERLANLKFDDQGMGNLSAKAIRQLLPLMSNGNNVTDKTQKRVESLISLNNSKEEQEKDADERLECVKSFVSDKKARKRLSTFKTIEDFKYLNYWEAAAIVYGSHSSKHIPIQKEILPVKQHSMNNPIVERIVNETISLVNEIHKVYGFDEVRIELCRELKASMDERQQMWEGNLNNQTKNAWAKEMLRELKKALIEDNRNADDIDDNTSIKNNINKIKILEDVVKYTKRDEYTKKHKEFKLDEPSKAEITKYLLWLEQNFKCPYTNQPIPLTDIFSKGKVVQIEHILPKERYYSDAYSNKVITWEKVNQAKGNKTAYEFIVSKRPNIDKIDLGNGIKKEVTLISATEWKDHVENMFPKGAKRTNLLRKEIPEDLIERTLKETQYINKKLKEKLSELNGENKVHITSGAITDILRDKWQLNKIFREQVRERLENFKTPTGKLSFRLKTIEEQEALFNKLNKENFEPFKIPCGKKFIEFNAINELDSIKNNLLEILEENRNISNAKKIKPFEYSTNEEAFEYKKLTYWTKQFNTKTNQDEDVEVFEGYSKRIDHRHHAMDAIIIACTKQNHIQYINSLNAINNADQENEDEKKEKYQWLKKDVCIGNSSKKFHTPWNQDVFIPEVAQVLNNIIVSHKNTRLLISPSKHKIDKEIKTNKVASIRGELHKETNYAKCNYYTGGKTAINKLISQILKAKMDNQNQTMVHFKSFEEIIKETVLKEKYQAILIHLFIKYDQEKLEKNETSNISKSILQEIQEKKLLFNFKTNTPLEWLSTYSDKDKSARPLGLSMNLNDAKELKDIANPRIKRLAEYRLNYVNEKCKEVDEEKELDKKDKDKKKTEIKALSLYSNAIYEVRVKKNNRIEWVEIKDLALSDIENIEYAKNETTLLIKNKINQYDLNNLKSSYFTNPISISKELIQVKKTRQLFSFPVNEVSKGRYVYSRDVFMSYIFNKIKYNEIIGKEIKFLKFIDAISIINNEKPDIIDYSKLIPNETINEDDNSRLNVIFTLVKNDIVYLTDSVLTEAQQKEIDWNNREHILPYLYVVKDMNPSRNEIKFQHINKADAIKISEQDAKSLFKEDIKALTEEIKSGDTQMWQRCIKVFSNKLGTKVIPYWEFPDGCWNKDKARELGLI